MLIAAAVFSFAYLLLLVVYLAGWLKLKKLKQPETVTYPLVTVIVPARNEENNILDTLRDLYCQEYPSGRFEIIVADDQSEDATCDRIDSFIREKTNIHPQIRLIHSIDASDDGFVAFKKKAIEQACGAAVGDYILLTDADCRRGPYWLRTMMNEMAGRDLFFLSGPVAFDEGPVFFEKLQALEFMSLVAIGAASIANHTPNMCNGANLGFRKEVFYQAGGYSGNNHIASGDDEFLLHKIFKIYPSRIGFVKDINALVTTRPFKTLSEFIQQRKRWVSKSSQYKRKAITLTQLFVYVYHLSLLLSLVAAFFSTRCFHVFILLFGVKLLAEFIFLLPVSRFFNKSRLLPYYPLAAFFYIFYVSIIGVVGHMGGYQWKGRKVR